MPHLDERAWVDRFMTTLSTLLPTLTPSEALARARATFPDAADLDPAEAAEIYALELPPTDAGVQGD